MNVSINGMNGKITACTNEVPIGELFAGLDESKFLWATKTLMFESYLIT